MDAVSVQKDGKHRPDNAWTRQKKKESSHPLKRTKMRTTATRKHRRTLPGNFRHFAHRYSGGHTKSNGQHAQQRRPRSCETMVAMVPHQHLRSPRKKSLRSSIVCKPDPNQRDIENVFVEEWIEVCVDSSEGQKTINAPVRLTTTAHDDETPLGQIIFAQNNIEALHQRCLFGHKN